MEGIAEILWELAHRLCSDEPLEQEWCFEAPFRGTPAGEYHPCPDGGVVPGQHKRQGASSRNRGFKKSGPQSVGRSRGGLTTKIHMVTASDRAAVSFSLSPGNAGDAPEGRKLLNFTPANKVHRHLIMDRAYEGDETRALAVGLGWTPVVPPKQNRKEPWNYDRETYKRRNEIERFFLRIKRFRRIFTRYDKLDLMFAGFILFAMIVDAIV